MRKAFTLIELLIVVAIIAILAAIAVPNFLEAQVRSKVARAKADMRTFATALETYTVDNNKPMTMVILGRTTWKISDRPSLVNGENPTVDCVSPRFMRLTTPIAYITSVLVDPFRPTGAGVDLASGGPSVVYDTYDYMNAFDVCLGGPSTFDTANATGWRGAGLTSGAAWRLACGGPDKINACGGGLNTAQYAANNANGVDYDPTNGTVSRGDIIRISSAPGPLNPNALPGIDRINNKYNF